MIQSIIWEKNCLKLLNQLKLPTVEEYVTCEDEEDVFLAIKNMIVRGAPAIGIVAAYGVVLGLKKFNEIPSEVDFLTIIDYLGTSRPTAINLYWALEKMKNAYYEYLTFDYDIFIQKMIEEAESIHQEDKNICLNIGINGLKIIENINKEKINILTHCNTGALATGGQGTALSVIYEMHKKYGNIHVYVDETRPYLQGARLTVYELEKLKIPYTLICDNMAGFIMSKNNVDLVIVGADRIARNGDTANKIGTYTLAVLAYYHKIPFYVAAPYTTFDLRIESGKEIPIEERKKEELIKFGRMYTAGKNTNVYNPAFDITPYYLIKGFITDKEFIDSNYEILDIKNLILK